MRNILDQDVFPDRKALDGLNIFKEPLQEESGNPYKILDKLHNNGSPSTVAQTGGRYFSHCFCFGNNPHIPEAKSRFPHSKETDFRLLISLHGNLWTETSCMIYRTSHP